MISRNKTAILILCVLTIINIFVFSRVSMIRYLIPYGNVYQVHGFKIFNFNENDPQFTKWTSKNNVDFSIEFNAFDSVGETYLSDTVTSYIKEYNNETYVYMEWEWRAKLKKFKYIKLVPSTRKPNIACQEVDMKISTCRAQFDMGMPFKLVHYYGPVVTSSFDPLEELARIESELFGFYYPYPLLFKHEQ